MVTVTIGVPFYNAEEFLADSVRSIFAQTFADWELILVDDGSTDRSFDIAKRIESDRVRVVSDGLRKGLSNRLNQIASLARGRFLARMDADDLMHPERIARQVAVLTADPAADLCGTDAYAIDANSRVKGVLNIVDPGITRRTALRSGRIIHPSVMGKVEWFRANPYDEAYTRAEDAELWARTFRSLNLRHIAEPLLFYRQGTPGSLSRYLRSGVTNLKIARDYGPSLCGVPGTVVLFSRTVLKMGCYSLCTAIGLESWLISRRSRPIGADRRAEAERISSYVRGHYVRGLDSASSLEDSTPAKLRRVS